MIWMIKL